MYRKKRSRTTVVQRGINPIAAKTITRLKYVQNFNRTLADGILSVYQFRLNSIFDPDFTGTGHQPYGHDTFATLYNRYRVFAASWIIRVVNNGSVNVIHTVLPENGQSTFSDNELLAETPRAITKLMSASSAGHNTQVFSGRIGLPGLTGQTSAQYKGEDRYQAAFGQNPGELITLHLGATANGGASTLTYAIQIIYHCELFDPLTLTKS